MSTINNSSNINYEYKINPSEDPLTSSKTSNVTETSLVIGNLNMLKSVDKSYATIGDILNYTVVITNSGNVLATNINFSDILPSNLTFVEGSVTIDSVSKPTFNPNTGFALSNLIILQSTTVKFQAEVTSLPNPNTVTNSASTTFEYLVIIPIQGSSNSNNVTTTINVNNLTIVKSANVSEVTFGDTLTYTTVITNIGNIDAVDIEFQDVVPDELTFVTGSVSVEGVSEPTYDPNDGFNLGTLSPGSSITVIFDTTVD